MALLYDRDVPTAQKIRDVSTELMYLKAEHTPVLSAIPKGSKPKASLVEYPFRARHAAAENAIEDGVDVVNGDLINNSSNKNMMYARTQQLRRAVGVSKRAQLLATEYTAKDQYADNLMDAMVAIKEDAELMILRDVDSVPGSSGVAEKTRGLLNWIRSANPGGSPDLPVPTVALAAAANIVSAGGAASLVTEDNFRAVLQSMAELSRSGARNIVAYVTPAMKAAFSNFTRTGTISATTTALRRFDQQPGKLVLNCTMYEGDFGNVMIVPHFAMPASTHAILVNHDEWKLRPAQNFQHEKLPFEGGIHKGFIDAFLCLQVDNPQAFGKITT